MRLKIRINYGQKPMQKQQGFTLLELIITIAIIGIVFVVGSQSGLSQWATKGEAKNTLATMLSEIGLLKDESLNRNTTTRMTLVNSSGTYTLTKFFSAAPTTTCSSAGSWTQISSREIDMSAQYEITGTAMANLCFYRDGTSSGGTFSIAPTDIGSQHKTYDLEVTIATGFIDVTEN